MANITLTKVQDPTTSRWLRAVSADYDVPRNAQVFWGWGLHDERVAVWVGEDGGGFGAIDGDSGIDECVFEPGTFNPAAETIELGVRSSLF